jgi:hypothetical protein
MSTGEHVARSIAQAIERYLALHQDASDSPAGIRSWWLPADLDQEPLSLVVRALEELQRRGVVVQTEIEGGGVVYSSAKRHLRS